jgi:hypothetical protein
MDDLKNLFVILGRELVVRRQELVGSAEEADFREVAEIMEILQKSGYDCCLRTLTPDPVNSL